MSDMTAYRSTDSDSKDTTDQFLVTKADAEHMYARRAPTRATRPTSHEKLSGSQRSPQPSRHMSRCMPLPRRCTSHQCLRRATADWSEGQLVDIEGTHWGVDLLVGVRECGCGLRATRRGRGALLSWRQAAEIMSMHLVRS